MKGGIFIKGIDVSKHQGDINWANVKSDNIEFAIIRAGYGNSLSQKDAKYDINYQGAKSNGLKVGAYWFSYAISVEDAIKEANVFINIIKANSLELPLFLDYEYDSINYGTKQGISITKELVTQMAKAFLDTLKQNGYAAGLYTNVDFINNWFDLSVLADYPVWLAKWTTPAEENNPPRDYGEIVCWQYSSKGSINGISGNVDMNYGYFTIETIAEEATVVSAPVTYPGASVTASVLNVRSKPGTSYSVIKQIKKGTQVDVLESYTNGWSKINTAGTLGYVNHSYLSTFNTPLVVYNKSTTITVGTKVKVKSGAKTYDGGKLASFVYKTVYTVLQVKGNRVVIGVNNVVTAAVKSSDLTIV